MFCYSHVLTRLFFFSVLLHNAIPFVGFGFLDNAIMIAAVSGMSLSVVQCFCCCTSFS